MGGCFSCLEGGGFEKAFLAERRRVVVRVRVNGRGRVWRGAWVRVPLRPSRERGARRDWKRIIALRVKQDIWKKVLVGN